jgi:two-component system, OmpR family, phosphate regulon sensor histidine kinase PhoR
MAQRFFPMAGIALAIACGVAMLFAGASPWLALAIVLTWIASFWLSVPPPAPVTAKTPAESMFLTRKVMRDLIENSGLPLILIDAERITMANSRAREALGAHVIGQDARVAFRHPAAIDLLGREEGGTATIQGLTGPRSNWQMTRTQIDSRYSLIELVDRTGEVDVSRAHTDFVANASHELRTPLASIIAYVETLADEGEKIDPVQANRFHANVLREARRLQSLVDDLMSLSRVEAEKHERPRELQNLNSLVRQSARDAAGADQKRLDRLSLDVPDAELNVLGDRNQLEQLVRNLVDNALKYGAADSQVKVQLASDERDMAILQVSDQGEGIAPEHIPHLTRRFYRTDPGRSRAAGGTGLGLAIVKHIVERHRGRLDISSQQGVGTKVTVRLPLAG